MSSANLMMEECQQHFESGGGTFWRGVWGFLPQNCLISDNNEQPYQSQVADLALWCQSNNLALNIKKTKEIKDFRRKQDSGYTPLTISGEPVERVPSFKYLGVHLTEDLTWTLHTQHVTK